VKVKVAVGGVVEAAGLDALLETAEHHRKYDEIRSNSTTHIRHPPVRDRGRHRLRGPLDHSP